LPTQGPAESGTALAPNKRFAQQNLGARRNSFPPRKSEKGDPMKLRFHGAGNMLPAMFLPIAYIPLANWLSSLF